MSIRKHLRSRFAKATKIKFQLRLCVHQLLLVLRQNRLEDGLTILMDLVMAKFAFFVQQMLKLFLSLAVGLLVACGLGIMRTMYASNNAELNCVAVDIVAKTLIVAAWKNALDYQQRTLTSETDATNENLNCRQLCVYNCASLHNMDLNLLVYDGQYHIRLFPFEKCVWLPGGGVTLCRFMNMFRVN